MPERLVVIFHHSPQRGAGPLTRVLGDVRRRLAEYHVELFTQAGADRVLLLSGGPGSPDGGASFGERLATVVAQERPGGVVILGSGSVPLLHLGDARSLVDTASARQPAALTNNRFSSDVCAVSLAGVLERLPSLPSDNALPRWLEERAGYPVHELAARDRLALDIDTPQDAAIASLAPGVPAMLRTTVDALGLQVPRLAELRALAASPRAEMLVHGRAGSATLRWLERHARCRVRFLAEERGLRASSAVAMKARPTPPARAPRSALGRLLERDGPSALAGLVAELGDGALIDSRVLLADHLGGDEAEWPSAEDRFASDLLRPGDVRDPWLRALTASAQDAQGPILLGGHTLVAAGPRILLRPGMPPRAPRALGRVPALR